jgi:putative membrane protein
MHPFISVLIVLNAALHLWFLILEMFLWQKPLGLKTFRLEKSFAQASASLAKNQGLYNGFLAAGLLWSLLATDPSTAHAFQVFFLSCMTVAGIYGAITVNKRILFIQCFPALITLALVIFTG